MPLPKFNTDYCRFSAVSEWQLKVSFSDNSQSEYMEATYILQRSQLVPGDPSWGYWVAEKGSGKATVSLEESRWKIHASGQKVELLPSGKGVASLVIVEYGYEVAWSDIIEVNGTESHLEFVLNPGGGSGHDEWKNSPYSSRFGGSAGGSFQEALPKKGLSIKGIFESGSGRWQWSLVPLKEISYTDYELKLRAFIPAPLAVAEPPIANVRGDYGFTEVHVGDSRPFSYDEGTERALQLVIVNLDPRRDSPIVRGPEYEFGESITYEHAPVRKVPNTPWWWFELQPGWADEHPGTRKTLERTDENCLVTVEQFPACSQLSIVFFGAAANPAALYPVVPAIDWNIRVILDFDYTNEQAYYRVEAQHDGFPAYELYLNKKRIYEYDPAQAGNSPLTLIPLFPPIYKGTGRLPIP